MHATNYCLAGKDTPRRSGEAIVLEIDSLTRRRPWRRFISRRYPADDVAKLEVKKFSKPDDLLEFEHGKASVLDFHNGKIVRRVFEPGWIWSKHSNPDKTKSCHATHFIYLVSGAIHVRMDDGTGADVGAGEVSWIPPGHDAWVVGAEPATVIDFQGAADGAKSPAKK
jgi:quercetin dioxygenase-like cupin family protein